MKTSNRFWYVLAVVLSVLLARAITAQTVTLEFTWTNTNTNPVGFDIMEVAAPPDTNRMIMYMNDTVGLIPNCTNGCSFARGVKVDNKRHYYRMSAYDPVAGKESLWSNVASCILAPSGTVPPVIPPTQNGLTTPINFKVTVKTP